MRNFSLRSLFLGFGSEPTDFKSLDLSQNPLPPCPGSPNCIRHSRSIQLSIELAFESCLTVLQQMNAEEISANRDAFRIEAVFKVFLFRDDVTIQLSEADDHQLTYLHIRSASRKGYSDWGVNRRRVATFLKKLGQELGE